jgi:hypothetical protein
MFSIVLCVYLVLWILRLTAHRMMCVLATHYTSNRLCRNVPMHAIQKSMQHSTPHLRTGLVAAASVPPASGTPPSSSHIQMGTASCLMRTLVSLLLRPQLMHSQNDMSNVGSYQVPVHMMHQSHNGCHDMLRWYHYCSVSSCYHC